MKPGRSGQGITVFPVASTVRRARSTAAASHPGGAISSTSRIAGAGLKKCRPRTRPGCANPSAMAATDSDEVFVASTASARRTVSSVANRPRFASSRSAIASITNPESARPLTDPRTCTRSSAASRSAPVSLPAATRASSAPARREAAVARTASVASVASTENPACANTCAMPRPIVPKPTTPITGRSAMPSHLPQVTAQCATGAKLQARNFKLEMIWRRWHPFASSRIGRIET